MSVNRFASHYMLSPGGKLVRWPVVTISDSGFIEKVHCFENGFVEQPLTRFFAGILIPAFLDIFADGLSLDIEDDPGLLNRHFRDGSLIIGVSGDGIPPLSEQQRLPWLISKPTIGEIDQSGKMFSGNGTLLERMKNQSSTMSLSEMLSLVTVQAAEIAELAGVGRIEQGFSPGLLLLQNVDMVNMQLIPETRVKWLNTPGIS